MLSRKGLPVSAMLYMWPPVQVKIEAVIEIVHGCPVDGEYFSVDSPDQLVYLRFQVGIAFTLSLDGTMIIASETFS